MPHILDGKKVAQKLKDKLKIEIENIKLKQVILDLLINWLERHRS